MINNNSLAKSNTHYTGQITSNPSIFNDYTLYSNNTNFENLDKSVGDDLTIFIHGTYSSPKDANKDFIKALSKTYNEKAYQFDWSGKVGTSGGNGADNKRKSRKNAALRLTKIVKNHKFKKNEKLNIVGHSHGGNVIKDFTQFYNGNKKIDNVTFMGTPVRSDHSIDYSKFEDNAKIINVYDSSDIVQKLGGFDNEGRSFAVQTIKNNNLKNIKVETPNTGIIIYPTSILNIYKQLIQDHSNLDSKEVWKQFNDK